jgi:hypothetical protein
VSIPTHGYGCRKICCYPTSCPSCGGNVFYYQCSCGSKVFFDTLGEWEVHGCRPAKNAGPGDDLFQGRRLSRRTKKRILRESYERKGRPFAQKPATPGNPIDRSSAAVASASKVNYSHSNGTVSKEPLLSCQICRKEIRFDRLAKHMQKQHRK